MPQAYLNYAVAPSTATVSSTSIGTRTVCLRGAVVRARASTCSGRRWVHAHPHQGR